MSGISERWLVWLLAAIHFIDIVDFMMVMPLGPDFARDLQIPTAQLGFIGASYTLAGGIAAIVATFWLDRFDRRVITLWMLAGLVVGTAGAIIAVDFTTLIIARIIAGIFGGVLTSLTVAMVADLVPIERRGQAMGVVMGAFSIAAIAGVPFGLELARWGSWHTPFIAVALLGAIVWVLTFLYLPPINSHLKAVHETHRLQAMWHSLNQPKAWLSYLIYACTLSSSFMIIPNVSAYLQFNLHFPREQLSGLYLLGGAASFITMQLCGRLTDQYGSFIVSLVISLLLIGVLYASFIAVEWLTPAWVMFAGFMMMVSARNVAVTTLISQVPSPQQRAGFMSLNSAVQHLFAALGSSVAAWLLISVPSGALIGMNVIAVMAILLNLFMLLFIYYLVRILKN